MLDFVTMNVREAKKGVFEIYPDFIVRKSKDLMIRGSDFYAIWDEENGLWSTDEDRAIELIDNEIRNFAGEYKKEHSDLKSVRVLYLMYSSSGMADRWHKYVQKQMPDNYHQLDSKLTFEGSKVKKTDYASKRLHYSLKEGDTSAYEELIGTLYLPDEKRKLEWAIGSIVAGESANVQKFIVLYGSAGTGKSTVLNIIQKLFDGYYSVFNAKALGSSSDSFALESLKSNPLVAIQHDGDLSRIEDNTRLNSVVSHEEMTVNEKFKSAYATRFNAFLFMGTNKPVKITDAKSGIIRRLIDVSPSGKKVPFKKYSMLNEKINFELGAIAKHCLDVYEEDPEYYNNYITQVMLGESNDFYNYILDSYDIFAKNDCTTLKAAWEMYKTYCTEANISYPMPMRIFKAELKNYFRTFSERTYIDDGTRVRNLYSGFLKRKFLIEKDPQVEESPGIIFESIGSYFDRDYADCPAQEASEKETPQFKWENVTTTLKDIDTRKVHYVRVPKEHIVIDFDLKDDETGEKSFEKNLEAASKWPATYAELSKSGAGIHLHYIYTGDVSKLSSQYADGIEVKVFTGKSSLRRKLTKCNAVPIATINSGLPLKGDKKKMVNFDAVKSEKGLRSLIERNLKKEIHGATAPSVDFINKILDDAYNSGLKYDVTDMRPRISSFAANSSHQAERCLKVVNQMKFKSEEPSIAVSNNDAAIIFYDVEVFPNLFVIVWKAEGTSPVKMINPSPTDVEDLLNFRLVGFNCRRYDNHILYARLMGYNEEQLFNLSQKIINGSKNAFFGEAYNISYADIYEFSSKKQSLKKFEIELGIHHQELGLPWDKPVPEDKWEKVADYCVNDVVATEAVWHARKGDFHARQILADLSKMSVNDTTRMHATKIIFGDDKKPPLVYTDLSEMFPGYTFDRGKSQYMGEDPGEGGYVYAEPGMYGDVALLDIASMHPTSIIQLNLFGPYTERFKEIVEARLAIKHKDFKKAKMLLNGALVPYLGSDEEMDALAAALKIVINSVYGFTTASFDNPFKDHRNIDNIVAKRGALFMVNLKHEVQNRGFTVAHIKTDSIKIPDATPEIISFVMEYGKQYGYNFEHEATYDRMCLVNDAVYIAKYKDGKHAGEWTATGTQFQVPYVFKKLFSKEKIEFDDMCETKSVSTALYLDFNEKLPEGEHNYIFVGKIGRFCPIKPGEGGGILLREKSDGGYASATGSKGYRWMESETVKVLNAESSIDESYYISLVDDAIAAISEYGDFEWFVSEDPYIPMNKPTNVYGH